MGGVHPLPSWGLRLCDTTRREQLVETGSIKDARVHYAGRGGGLLSEIRNIVDGRVSVKGGGT